MCKSLWDILYLSFCKKILGRTTHVCKEIQICRKHAYTRYDLYVSIFFGNGKRFLLDVSIEIIVFFFRKIYKGNKLNVFTHLPHVLSEMENDRWCLFEKMRFLSLKNVRNKLCFDFFWLARGIILAACTDDMRTYNL